MSDPTPRPIDDPTDPKPWWQSKSVWLMLLLSIIGIGNYFTAPEHTPAVTIPSIAAAVAGVGGVVLRVWFTSAPIVGTRRAVRALAARVARAGQVAQVARGNR